ncbi:putative L-fucose-proton symporter [Lipomyces starkeyi]
MAFAKLKEFHRKSNAISTGDSGTVTVRNDQVTARSAAQLSGRESLPYIALVTCLFFSWGFAYGLLDSLNSKVQEAFDLTRAQSGGLQASYFGAYFLCPLTVSGWILRRFGFKVTFIVGLVVYGIGALMFWPSSVKHSFGGYCASMFIVASGLATLETAADPYISICGPVKYTEIRLNFAQGFQGLGGFVAPLIASRVIFKNSEASELSGVQWTYLGVACFVFVLAVIFYFAPIPEVTDKDMELVVASFGIPELNDKPFIKQYALFYGVLAQFSYVGAQVALAGYFVTYTKDVIPSVSSSHATDLLAAVQAVYATSRFIAVGLMHYIKPRYIYCAYIWACVAFAIAASQTTGSVGVGLYGTVFFFESCCFATIFTSALKGLGRHTKWGGSMLVSAISGGALFPSLMGLLGDSKGNKMTLVPMCGYVIAGSHALFNLTQGRILDWEPRIPVPGEEGNVMSLDEEKAEEFMDEMKAGKTTL